MLRHYRGLDGPCCTQFSSLETFPQQTVRMHENLGIGIPMIGNWLSSRRIITKYIFFQMSAFLHCLQSSIQ